MIDIILETTQESLIAIICTHRSDTSAITHFLEAMGVSFGNNMSTTHNQDNDKAIFGDLDIVALNEEILKACGKAWPSLEPFQQIDMDYLCDRGYFTRAVELLQEKLSIYKIYGLRDPQVSKLIYFWSAVIKSAKINTKLILSVRNPLSTVNSLKEEHGLHTEQAYLHWIDSALNSLACLHDHAFTLVDYDKILNKSADEFEKLSSFISRDLNPKLLLVYLESLGNQGCPQSIYFLGDIDTDTNAPLLAKEIYKFLTSGELRNSDIMHRHGLNKIEQWKKEYSRMHSIFQLSDMQNKQILRLDLTIAKQNSQIALLDQTVIERDDQISNLSQSINETRFRILAMESSNSWLLTKNLSDAGQWLATTRQLFLNYKRRILSIKDRIQNRLPGQRRRHSHGFSASKSNIKDSSSSQISHEKESEKLKAGIVFSSEESITFTGDITLIIWAWAQAEMTKKVLWLDNKIVCGNIILPTASNLQDAQRIGTAILLDSSQIAPGPHEIRLQISDSAGREINVTHQMISQTAKLTYESFLASQSLTSQCNVVGFQHRLFVVLYAEEFLASESCLARATLESISKQIFQDYHIVCCGSSDKKDLFKSLLLSSRIPSERIHFSESLHDYISKETAALLVFPAPGTILREECLSQFIANWNLKIQLVYSDHDYISTAGQYHTPNFTWSWAPDLMLSTAYVGDVFCLDGVLLSQSVNKIALDPSQANWRHYMLCKLIPHLSLKNVKRIPRFLWGDSEDRTFKPIANASHQWQLPAKLPSVSIIIPTTGNLRYLAACINTLAQTDYPDFEVVILDNGRGQYRDGITHARKSGATIVECNEAFNWSRLNNIGVKHSTGEMLLFLNDDVEILHPEWLAEMVRHALRQDVGTVGSLLLYPNGAIQHAGVLLVDYGGGARHLFHKQLPGKGIFQQLDKVVREVSANTGACLMIRRELFNNIGKFDESLGIVGNDIDLSLRCLELGLRNVWTPHSRLIHHESVSRQAVPIDKDEKYMWRLWRHRFNGGDPYYHPALSLKRGDCELAELPDHQTLGNYAAPQTNQFGVNLVAYIRASMGVGEAARGNAAGLQASGIPFAIINYEHGNPARMDNMRWQQKETQNLDYNINLIHINADHLPDVAENLGRNALSGRYNIGYWAWEMPEFPDQWLDSFNLLDEVWVPSTFVNRAVAAASPVPVITIPHIIEPNMIGANKYSRAWFGINRSAFVFLSLFDTHSISMRKNPFGSIAAFKKAFAPSDQSVQLIIKVNNADKPICKELTMCIEEHQNILVLKNYFDREQVDSLINSADCYVSLHHAEGFGLGPAEAMAMGKVAMLTDWSGNREYMHSDNCIPISYVLKKLGKDYGPYDASQYWAIPNLDHASAEMKDLVNNPERVRTLGKKAAYTISDEFSATAIGRRMKQRLLAIKRIRE